MTRGRADRARSDALTAFLNQKTNAGYIIESRTATQAIIVRKHWPLCLLDRFRPGTGQRREVVSVDEAGRINSIAAEPWRW
jgi:hypothetical protein